MIGRTAGPFRILHLEDSDLDAELIEAELERLGHPGRVGRSHQPREGDLVLPAFDGISAFRIAQAQCPDIPFVFCSGTLGEDIAVEALKDGATDYVTKQRIDRLPRIVVRALAEARTRAEKRAAEAALQALNQ